MAKDEWLLTKGSENKPVHVNIGSLEENGACRENGGVEKRRNSAKIGGNIWRGARSICAIASAAENEENENRRSVSAAALGWRRQ